MLKLGIFMVKKTTEDNFFFLKGWIGANTVDENLPRPLQNADDPKALLLVINTQSTCIFCLYLA